MRINKHHRPYCVSKTITLALWLLWTLPLAAQDTLRLGDQTEMAQADDVLLNLLERQAQELHLRDSLRQDSLYKNLLIQEAALKLQLKHVQDSLEWLRPLMPQVQQEMEDSIERTKQDAIRQLEKREYKLALDIAPSLVYDAEEDMREIREAIKQRESNWRKDFNLSLQFSQNFISPNWYQGGNSNFTILGIQKGEVWYTKDKLNWYTMAEWRLGVMTSTGDSLRKYNFTDDLFRIYSKIGYQVVKNLDISSSVDFQTNFFTVWNANQRTAKMAPLTPIRFNYTIGVDYKPVKNMSIVASPLAYKMVYAYHTEPEMIDITTFGIEAGKNILNDIGSSIRITYKWQPLREIKLDTEFYLYTNYQKVEIDWEINCNFIINRFVSARLTLHPRYDNTVKSKDDKAHIQFKELLSIGFAHRFK